MATSVIDSHLLQFAAWHTQSGIVSQNFFKKPLANAFGSDNLTAPFPLKGMDSMFADR